MQEWRKFAACGKASESEKRVMTSPLSAKGMTKNASRVLARKYCHNCPVIAQCGDWAESEPYFNGIAGGRHFGWESGRTLEPDGRKQTPL
jgi:hypothetical protein